jgi:predicted P-loop ATPase
MTVLPFPAPPGWLAKCQHTEGKNPKPLVNLHNALIGLREGEWREALGYDEMRGRSTVRYGDDAPKDLTEQDLVYIQEWLQEQGLRMIARLPVQDAAFTYCRERGYHPVREWLGGLMWDGQPRLRTWLQVYLGAEDSDYTRQVGAMFMIAMVARIFNPGCKCDYMLVLEGPQGKQKSAVCSVLAGGYFSDHLPDIAKQDKDASIHLNGKWLIEIAELHAFSKAESTQLKSFISRTHERYRPPFGRVEIDQPRQCLFIGTTNKEVYLRDETGGRRFWPVRCGHITVKNLREAREQLFAEAVDAYRSDIPWWPDYATEERYFKPQQDSRYDADAWEESIALFVTGKADVTVKEVAIGALGFHDALTYSLNGGGTPLSRLGTADQNRITKILESLNWRRGSRMGQRRPWIPPKA